MKNTTQQSRSPKTLENALLLTPRGDEVSWDGAIPEEWSQGRACFGGVLLAIAARACDSLVEQERSLRSVNVTYVAPAAPGPIVVKVEKIREGGSVTHFGCRILQNEKTVTLFALAYGLIREGCLSIPPLPLTWDGEPGVGHELPYIPPMTPQFTQHLEYRWTLDSVPFSGSEKAHVKGWIRPAIPIPVDAAQILMLLDAYPPPIWSKADRIFMASSLSSHFQIRNIPSSEENPHPWFFYDGPASVVGQGYSDVQARLWHEDGTLVAVGMQQFVDFSNR